MKKVVFFSNFIVNVHLYADNNKAIHSGLIINAAAETILFVCVCGGSVGCCGDNNHSYLMRKDLSGPL